MTDVFLPTTRGDGVAAFLKDYGGPAGTFIRLSRDGRYRRASDGAEVPLRTKVIVPYEGIQHGWIKFNGKGEPPTREMGPMFGGYVPPARTDLGDDDQSLWQTGLSGKPEDPWKPQVLVPMQDVDSGELYVFQTSSVTGLRAVGLLVAACKSMMEKNPDEYPIFELRISEFEHKDSRIGVVTKPDFVRVGKAPRNGTAQIDHGAAMDDEIPF